MISILAMSIIKKMRAFLLAISFKYYRLKGGYRDSNPGPPEPQSGALTNCTIPTIYTYRTMLVQLSTLSTILFSVVLTSLGGFEPSTYGLEGRCSIQLSYRLISLTTPKTNCFRKAGDGNRTHVSSLEGWCSTIELHPQITSG